MSPLLDNVSIFFGENTLLLSAIVLIISFLFSFKLIPFIVHISLNNNLIVEPNERSSHKKSIPQLGGLGVSIPALFFTSLFGTIMLPKDEFSTLLVLITCILFLLITGLKDDITGLPPFIKLFVEIITTLFFIIGTDIRIDNFYGIFGVYELSIIQSYIYTLFVFIIIINSYNLIDGIDGLAGLLGVVVFTCFFYFFAINDFILEMIICSSIIGGLIAFLRYNLSDGRLKIFMGDVGTLVLGFLLAVFSTITLSKQAHNVLVFENKPVFVLALFALPFLDTLRIFFIRGLSGISPFAADKNHLHHKLLNYGFSHVQVTLILICYCLLVIGFCYMFRHFKIHLHLILTMSASIILLLLLLWWLSKRKLKQ